MSRRQCHLSISSVAVLFVAVVGATSCGNDRLGTDPETESISVVYAVDLLPLGTEGQARVTFRTPNGSMASRRVRLPWQSELYVFGKGDPLRLEAKALVGPDLAVLQCTATSEVGNPEGTVCGGSVRAYAELRSSRY